MKTSALPRRWPLSRALSFLPLAASLAAGCGSTPAATSDAGSDAGGDPRITLFPQPGSGPWMIAAGPDGNMWFTERGHSVPPSGKIARMTLSGEITEFPVSDGSQPWWITAGPDGAMWFTEYYGQKIGRITVDGTITEYPVQGAHSFPIAMTSGPDGNLWFTESTYATDGSRIGNIAKITTDGTVTEFPIGTEPGEIAAGPDGNIWYIAFSDTAVGRFSIDGQTTTEFPVPQSNIPHGLVAGPDGNIWVTEATGLGRISLADGTHTMFELPGGSRTDAQGQVIAGTDGALWFASDSTSSIGRVTVDGSVTTVRLPGPLTPIAGIAQAPDGSFWLTDSWNDQIVRFRP